MGTCRGYGGPGPFLKKWHLGAHRRVVGVYKAQERTVGRAVVSTGPGETEREAEQRPPKGQTRQDSSGTQEIVRGHRLPSSSQGSGSPARPLGGQPTAPGVSRTLEWILVPAPPLLNCSNHFSPWSSVSSPVK